jgi:glycosyltransferase involved in cell wall biosynthesis
MAIGGARNTPHAAAARPARVLQVALSLVPGGTERLVIEIAKRLAPSFPMAVCLLDEPGAWAAELAGRGIPVAALFRAPGFRPSLALRIARVAAAHRADIIHCHQYSPFVYGALAALVRPGTRVVFTEHGRLSDAPASFKRRLANRIVAHLPASIFAVSFDLRRHMIAEGFPAPRVGVIWNGIDPGPPPGERDRVEARCLLGIGAERLVVGTVARLDPVKDLPSLVFAFAALRRARPEALLAIVGDGPERPKIEAAAREAEVAADVLFTGQRADVRRILPAFDLFVNSSVSEGISLTILEAMAACLPVVATRVGGTPEVVKDGETGVLVPARDRASLGQALLDLAGAPKRARELGRAGRARVEKAFSIDRMVADYARVYGGSRAR